MLLKNNLTVMYLGVPENPMAIKDTFPASFSLLLDYIYKGESDFQLFNQVYLSLFWSSVSDPPLKVSCAFLLQKKIELIIIKHFKPRKKTNSSALLPFLIGLFHIGMDYVHSPFKLGVQIKCAKNKTNMAI